MGDSVKETIGFVGGGAMAQAIAEGLIKSGRVSPANITASAATDRTREWWTAKGMNFTTNNADCIERSQVIFISVKPHLYQGVSSLLVEGNNTYPDRLWISIMAGVTLADLTAALAPLDTSNTRRIVRTIPNTPVKVGKGSIGITFSPTNGDYDRQLVMQLLSSVARCEELPERLQNSFAAMAGSGPAYIYQVIEALADGGVMMGLPRDLAMEHAAAMVEGAATMVLEAAKSGKHPAKLKDEVCSPGGSTIKGVQKLEEGGVRAAFMSAVQAAAERNAELGKK